MLNLQTLKQEIYRKEKRRLTRKITFFNIVAVFIIFVSLSSIDVSDREKKYIEQNIELSQKNDSLTNFISNELNELKSREKEIIRNTIQLSTDQITIIDDFKIDDLYDYYNSQNINYNIAFEILETKWDSIHHLPIGNPLNISVIGNISDNYGYRKHPILKRVLFHDGIDISAPIGSPIFSTGKGVIEKVHKLKKGYGHHVVINHMNGYKTIYAHMDEILIKKGDKVNIGTQIGTVGNTGLSTGPHLHYEIVKNNKTINPISYITVHSVIANK